MEMCMKGELKEPAQSSPHSRIKLYFLDVRSFSRLKMNFLIISQSLNTIRYRLNQNAIEIFFSLQFDSLKWKILDVALCIRYNLQLAVNQTHILI